MKNLVKISIFALALGFFASCGDSTTTTTEATPAPATEAAPAPTTEAAPATTTDSTTTTTTTTEVAPAADTTNK